MSQLILRKNRHPPGEYAFTAGTLALSFSLKRCKVEMADEGRLWSGTSERGDIKLLPSGYERIFRHQQSCEFAFIAIEPGLLDDERPRPTFRPHFILRDAPLRLVIDALLTEGAAAPTTALFQHAAGAAIVARLKELEGMAARPPAGGLPPLVLARVVEFLHAHLAEDVSIEQLAAEAGLSKAHFSTSFRASTGEPPHRFHTRLRVERARSLLQQGVSAAEAALRVGFCDQSHLARHMRRLFGKTPSMVKRGR